MVSAPRSSSASHGAMWRRFAFAGLCALALAGGPVHASPSATDARSNEAGPDGAGVGETGPDETGPGEAGPKDAAVIYGPPIPSTGQRPDDAPASAGRKKPRPGREALRNQVMEAARAAGMPPELADAVATVESNYNTAAIGGVGEIGLMQVLPSTARMLGFGGTLTELATPETNIRYGVNYLSRAWRISGGDICTTVMKYRAGHGESRFSHKSVDYCIRVRAHLAANGYKVTGEVPKATFGAPASVRVASRGGVRVAGGRRSRYNWRAADARMKSISSKVSFNALIIAR